MRSIVVTGATGLIGVRLVQLLGGVGQGIPVARQRLQATGFENAVQADLADPGFVQRLPGEADVLVHLAQSRAFNEFPEQAADVFAVNVAATARLLDWARRSRVRMVVIASSGGIYPAGSAPHLEDEIPAPSGRLAYYYSTRWSAEMLAKAYADYYTVVVLRFFFVYGPGQAETMLVPRLVRAVSDGRALDLQGEQGMRFNPIHVDDAARAILKSLELANSETINIAGAEVVTVRDVGEAIAAALGVQAHFRRVEGGPTDLVGDIAKMTRLLGKPRISLREGIASVVAARGARQ